VRPHATVQSGVFAMNVIVPVRVGVDGGTGTVGISLFVRFPDAKFKIRRPIALVAKVDDFKDYEDVKYVKLQGGSMTKLDPYREAIPTQIGVGLDLASPQKVGHYNMGFSNREGNRMKKKQEKLRLGWYLTTPSFAVDFDWGIGDPSSTILMTIPMTVCPTSYQISTLVGPSIADVTTMEYAARIRDQYRFKRLKLRVEIICTKFHVGKIAVIARYGTLTAPTNVLEAFTTLATTIDAANGSNTYDFTFNWVSDRKWLLTPYRPPDPGDDLDFILGNIYIMVVNPLQANTLVTGTLSILTYLSVEGWQGRSGAVTMQLACPVNSFDLSRSVRRGARECAREPGKVEAKV